MLCFFGPKWVLLESLERAGISPQAVYVTPLLVSVILLSLFSCPLSEASRWFAFQWDPLLGFLFFFFFTSFLEWSHRACTFFSSIPCTSNTVAWNQGLSELKWAVEWSSPHDHRGAVLTQASQREGGQAEHKSWGLVSSSRGISMPSIALMS